MNLRAIVGVFKKIWTRKLKMHRIQKGDLDTQIKKDYHHLDEEPIVPVQPRHPRLIDPR